MPRSRFRTALLLALLALLLASPPILLADEDGWTDLLSGNDLAAHWTTKGNWSINDDGVVTLEPRPGEKGWSRFDAYLWSTKQYRDFEIEFDYKVQKGGNSGFYFHVGDKTSPVAKGIEVQIYASHEKGADAKLTDHDSGGIIPGIPPTKNLSKPAGEWNRFQIVSQGRSLSVRLNSEVVNEVDLEIPKSRTGRQRATSASRTTGCRWRCARFASANWNPRQPRSESPAWQLCPTACVRRPIRSNCWSQS
jgi:hypothetical protein